MTLIEALPPLLSSLTTGVVGGIWFWDYKKKTDSKVLALESKVSLISEEQVKHSNQFITEPRTRELIREEIKAIKEDIAETKTAISELKSMTQELVTELRVLYAVQEVKNAKEGK